MEIQAIKNTVTLLGKFKDLKRTGWKRRQVDQPESDAEHSFSLALLVMLTIPAGLNRQKCLEMALIHDLAEIYVGDLTPDDSVAPKEKNCLEMQAMKRISQELSMPYFEELFSEFETQQTPEARFVKALDKLDTVLTACYYDQNKRAPVELMPEFSAYAQKCLSRADTDEVRLVKNMLYQIVKKKY